MNLYLSNLIEDSLLDLEKAGCIVIDENIVGPSPLGLIASKYYLKYTTMEVFSNNLKESFRFVPTIESPYGDFPKLLQTLSKASEFDELPVRHNEGFPLIYVDLLNRELEMQVPIPVTSDIDKPGYDVYLDPHVKTFLLLQAHLSHSSLPMADYVTDTISVLDNTIRITQAMIDFALLKGGMNLVLGLIRLLQCIKQGLWITDSPLLQLPHVTLQNINLPEDKRKIMLLQKYSKSQLESSFSGLTSHQLDQIHTSLNTLPSPKVDLTILGAKEKEGRWFINKSSGSLIIECTIKNRLDHHRYNLINAYLPRFPKPQSEGWFLILSQDTYDRVKVMKRVLSTSRIKTRIQVELGDEDIGDLDFNFRLVSDCYLGIDIQIKISTTITNMN